MVKMFDVLFWSSVVLTGNHTPVRVNDVVELFWSSVVLTGNHTALATGTVKLMFWSSVVLTGNHTGTVRMLRLSKVACFLAARPGAFSVTLDGGEAFDATREDFEKLATEAFGHSVRACELWG